MDHDPLEIYIYIYIYISQILKTLRYDAQSTSIRRCKHPSITILQPKGPFGNVVLIMLFNFLKIRVGEKMCGNTYNIV